MRRIISVAVSFVATSLFAASWTGDVEIAAGESVEITDGDIASIENSVTSIRLGEGSSVVFSGSGSLRVGAPISGSGTFSATGGGTLVLLGDNSGLVAPGHFEFVNSLGVVSNEFGLGGAETGAAKVQIDDSDDARAKYSLRFGSSTGAITNHVDIAFDTKMNIGSESQSENLVMDATLRWQKAEALNNLFFKGNTEFISGGISTKVSGSLKHCYVKAAAGYLNPTLRFSGNSKIEVNYWFDRGVKTYFNQTTSFGVNLLTDDSPTGGQYVCERENALPNILWGPTPASCLDLGGYNQTVQGISFQYGAACTDLSKTDYSSLTSSEPAKLVVSQKQELLSRLLWGLKVTGAASLEKSSADHIKMVKMVSDTTGELLVSGGILEFSDGAGWDNGSVVLDGGTLIASSGSSMTSGKTALVVRGNGSLKIADNITLVVKSAEFGSGDEAVVLKPGIIYSIADLEALGLGGFVKAADDAADRSGKIEVFEDLQWYGWPEESGKEVVVPKNMALTVGPEDAALVAQASSIKMSMGSSITFSGLGEKLVLPMPITAASTTGINVKNGSHIVLAGDNRAYLGSTAIDATSSVIVSNRYGLGSSVTKPCVVAERGILKFGGEGLTNDVPITADLEGKPEGGEISPRQFHVNLDDGVFVQNGAYICGRGPNVILGDAIFNSSITSTGLSPMFKVDSPFSMVMNGKVTLGQGQFSIGNSTGRFCFNYPGTNEWSKIYSYTSYAKVVCGCADAISSVKGSLTNIGFYAVMPKPEGIAAGHLDLNGYDQSIHNIVHGESGRGWNAGDYYSITSALPAVVTVSPIVAETRLPLRFCGAAGFNYAGTGMFCLVEQLSRTTGDLIVSSGTLALQDNAGWCGSNVWVKAGTLSVLAGSSDRGTRAFGGIRSAARIVVSQGATLELGAGVYTHAKSIVSGERFYNDYGPYGSQSAYEAGLVDAEHVIEGLSGLGLISFHEQKRGMAIICK